jgi:glutamyl-tRNA reductase
MQFHLLDHNLFRRRIEEGSIVKVAIVGTGNMVSGVARNSVMFGYAAAFAGRNSTKTRRLTANLGVQASCSASDDRPKLPSLRRGKPKIGTHGLLAEVVH